MAYNNYDKHIVQHNIIYFNIIFCIKSLNNVLKYFAIINIYIISIIIRLTVHVQCKMLYKGHEFNSIQIEFDSFKIPALFANKSNASTVPAALIVYRLRRPHLCDHDKYLTIPPLWRNNRIVQENCENLKHGRGGHHLCG